MFNPLAASARCNLFENISVTVWDKVVVAHSVGMDLDERGLTKDVIVAIRDFHQTQVANFHVYARPGWKENAYGSDIDVFVETLPNQYTWFALQAKLLKQNGTYDTLLDTSDGVMQWIKLKLLHRISGGSCIPKYLFYNGKSGYTKGEHDCCGRQFNEKQYGCSLITLEGVMKYARNGRRIWRKNKGIRRRITMYKSPSYENFHPEHAEPWRVLVCCYHPTAGRKLYSITDIQNASYSYIDLIVTGIDGASLDTPVPDPVNTNSPISVICKQAGWNPGLRIVVSRTDRLQSVAP